MQRNAITWTACCLIGDLAVLCARPALASDSNVNVNYAFANQLGSGIYSVNGRTVQIYNFSASVPLRRPGPRRLGFALLLPLSVGFYDFKVKDVVDGFPDFLSTMSLVPSLECEVPVKESWWILPSVGAGLGKDLTTGGTSFVYVLEGRSLIVARPGAWDLRVGNRFCYSGYTADSAQPTDDFALLESGADLLHGLGFHLGHREATASLFTVNYIYSLSPQFVKQIPQEADIRASWEVGFTLGTFPACRLIGIPLPRLGVGWRFGDGPSALRIVLGEPFPVRLPTEEEREPGHTGGDDETR